MEGGVPLNGAATSGAATNADPLNAILEVIKNLRSTANPQEATRAVAPIPELRAQLASNPTLSDDLERLHYLGSMNFDPAHRNKDEGDWSQVAERVEKEVQKMKVEQQAQQQQTQQQMQQMQQQQTMQPNPMQQNPMQQAPIVTAAQNFKKKDPNHNKKSRGNPFRVLMGQCGKLQDAGIKKSSGVAYLLRQHRFPRETIERCWGLVEDYNRKKNFKEEREPKETQPKADKPKEHTAARMVDGKDIPEPAESLYDVEPNWSTRSTAELFMRLCFLHSVDNYGKDTPQGDGKKAADTKGVRPQMKAIKTELERRGFDAEEYENILK